MNWIKNVVRPRIQGMLTKKDTPDNLWITCPKSGKMVFHRDVEANQFVIPESQHHMRIGAKKRFEIWFDEGKYDSIDVPDVPLDPLKFRDEKKYTDRLKASKTKTGNKDSVELGVGKVKGLELVTAVQDFGFMGGSLGMAAGEAIIVGMQEAIKRKTGFVLFASSGGARMQEGILSLMQMPRTTVAVQQLRAANLPYTVVLTDPTTGGVTASYAMLGDIHIAEPDALICFAGPRVIEQTIREKLPEGFQKSDYLYEHGMVDMVVHRHDMRDIITRLCLMFLNKPSVSANDPVEQSAEVSIEDDVAENALLIDGTTAELETAEEVK
ncbi:MAG: acetyl-CoA carboxylase carboxyltransferase subunit beta [Rhizobiales bacterium]|nr:acetyl-CoA carboxylase carboxyltransferase subunit beta [Hyphomicrobiales bacterium]